MVDLIVFPSSFFSISKVDEDLQSEYDAVKATGLFDVILSIVFRKNIFDLTALATTYLAEHCPSRMPSTPPVLDGQWTDW